MKLDDISHIVVEGWLEGGEFNGITSQSEEKGLAYLYQYC
jgi:hypothetical protein